MKSFLIINNEINKIQEQCIDFMNVKDYKSFDLYDALTNPALDSLSRNNSLLRRIIIQINAKSPIDLHWTGMKKMVHTKTISDLLWYHSISDSISKNENVNKYFTWLLSLKNERGYGWGLNFAYTSRFIDADKGMPNLYNTINSGISICYSYEYLSNDNRRLAQEIMAGILQFLDTELGFVDEGNKGWYLYYPNQKYPTYNVNALTLYFLTFIKKIGIHISNKIEERISKIISLLLKEQEADGSWFYSRSEKGKWIDGFHSAFIIESIAFAYKSGYNSTEIKFCIDKGWSFYINNMFTKDGFPRYFTNSGKYPIESQNTAQAIQTISTLGMWLNKDEKKLLKTLLKNTIHILYNKKGYFIHKKSKFWNFNSSYFRWSTTPMLLSLEYAKQYLKPNEL